MAGGGGRGRPYSAEIKRAEFFYLDKFVLVAAGGTLHMYTYGLEALEEKHRQELDILQLHFLLFKTINLKK